MAPVNHENILLTGMQRRVDLFRNQMKLIVRDRDLLEAEKLFILFQHV